MPFSEMSKKEAVRLIEAKIKGEESCYSTIVNEAIRMIKEERMKVERYEKSLKWIVDNFDSEKSGLTDAEYHCQMMKIAKETLKN